MNQIERRANGQFSKGTPSPNPAGRGAKLRFKTPSEFRVAILDISRRIVPFRMEEDGPVEEMTLFERHLLCYSGGPAQSRLGSKDFVELVQRVSAREEWDPLVPAILRDLPSEAWDAYNKVGGRKARAHQKSSSRVVRDSNGRYRGCGNPRGRPLKAPPPRSLELDRIALRIANRPHVMPETSERVTLFEAQVLSLGYATGSARVATRRSIEATLDAAWRVQHTEHLALREEVIAASKASRGGVGF